MGKKTKKREPFKGRDIKRDREGWKAKLRDKRRAKAKRREFESGDWA